MSNCEECGTSINRKNQEKGYYIIGGNDIVCSQKCLVEYIGEKQFQIAQEERDEEGDSDIYYWSYDD